METSRLARSFALAAFLGTATVGGLAMDAATPEVAEAYDNSYFYASLAPHGSWVQHLEFGWVWYPNHRAVNWRPYSVGRWEWTDYGEWLWVSDEPYGWATYHYGRWFLDPMYGWVWLPGNTWAPAWVSWRTGGDYIGWSPLSPWGFWDVRYNRYRDWDRYNWRRHHHHDNDDGDWHGRDGDWDRDGHRDWDRDGDGWDRDRDRASYDDYRGGYRDNQDTWNFTRKRDFTNPRVDKVVLDRKHMPDVYRTSRDLPAPSEQDARAGRGITRAVDKASIERAAGRQIRPVKIEDADAPTVGGGRGSDGKSDRVRVFRPKVTERADAPTPDKLGLAKDPRSSKGRGTDGAAREGVTDTRGRGAGGASPRTEPARSDGDDARAPARGETGKQPQSPGKGRDDSGTVEKTTRPSRPDAAAPRGSTQRGGKSDGGAYERPGRDDERGGYERGPRASDPVGHVRPSTSSGRGAADQPAKAKQPARVQEPSRANPRTADTPRSQPTRVEQPTRSQQQPSRVQQPTRSQQPVRVQEPKRSQPAPRVQQQPSRVQPPRQQQQPARVQQPRQQEQPARAQQPRQQQPSRVQQPRQQQPQRTQQPARVQQPSAPRSAPSHAPSPSGGGGGKSSSGSQGNSDRR